MVGRRGGRQGWGTDLTDTDGGWFDGQGWFSDGWFATPRYTAKVDNGCPQCGSLMYTSRRRSG